MRIGNGSGSYPLPFSEASSPQVGNIISVRGKGVTRKTQHTCLLLRAQEPQSSRYSRS